MHCVLKDNMAVDILAFLCLAMTVTVALPTSSYLEQRKVLIGLDQHTQMGANLTLSDQEKIVDALILKEKRILIDASINNKTIFGPSLSFFKAKPIMEKLKLFKTIQAMPKGGILHIHDLAAGNLDWLIKNATYRDHIHMCVDTEGYIRLAAFLKPPSISECPWKSVKSEREASGDALQFDDILKQNISFLATDPVSNFEDNDRAWIRFNKYFAQVKQLVFYMPVFKDYLWDALERIRADNCQYIEYRGQLSELYDLDGKLQDAEFGMLMVQDILQTFTTKYPDFVGGKVIMTGFRHLNKASIMAEVKTAVYLRQKYPDFFLGYDLVGDEVWYYPLIYYIDALLYPSNLPQPVQLPYYFHAGETDWQNTDVDYNLVDALLLNTTRIGHGYALAKHPHLARIVKDKQIAVEVNPVSNQVLRLVTDLRNHPMVNLMSDNFPLVVSSDDPGAWDALPLSHDFFLAFVDMSGRDTGLAFLKQLAINSIRYSGMSEQEKAFAMGLWQRKWDKFIKDQISMHSLSSPLRYNGN